MQAKHFRIYVNIRSGEGKITSPRSSVGQIILTVTAVIGVIFPAITQRSYAYITEVMIMFSVVSVCVFVLSIC